MKMPLTVHQRAEPTHLGRVWGLLTVAVLVLVGLLARLWVLQVVRYPQFERLALQNRIRREPAVAPRGGIFDRRGELLAGSRMSSRVSILDLAGPSPSRSVRPAVTNQLPDLPQPEVTEQLERLTAILDLTPEELTEIRAALADPGRPRFTPVVVRDDVSGPALTQLEESLWELPDVVIERVPLRWYPLGRPLAHVVGYVGVISPEELRERRARQDEQIAALSREVARARRELTDEEMPRLQGLLDRLAVLQRLRSQADSIVGKTGLEAQYETDLGGEPAMRTWLVNARNDPVLLLGTTPGEPGHSLHLNLDSELQRLAAEQLGSRRGSVVALDPRDGAVLALYGSPSYDNNLFVPRISRAAWNAIVKDPAKPLQNRAIRNIYPPGSTFKMISSAAGLKAGVIRPGTAVSCPGGMTIGSRFKRCWTTHGGGIDHTRALALSCDVFYYRAGLKMGPEPLREMAHEFGLGEPTGIDLPNEVAGRFPTDEWHRRVHRREWYPGDTANVVIGQGDVLCTSLQMAVATAIVANRGRFYRPRLVREVRDREGRAVRPWRPELVRQVDLPPAEFDKIRAGMRAAVTAGTARAASLETIAVAGKTGSAEDPGRHLPHAWFVCFAPYDNPTIALAVMVENAGHGGSNGAPVAKALLERYFQQTGAEP